MEVALRSWLNVNNCIIKFNVHGEQLVNYHLITFHATQIQWCRSLLRRFHWDLWNNISCGSHFSHQCLKLARVEINHLSIYRFEHFRLVKENFTQYLTVSQSALNCPAFASPPGEFLSMYKKINGEENGTVRSNLGRRIALFPHLTVQQNELFFDSFFLDRPFAEITNSLFADCSVSAPSSKNKVDGDCGRNCETMCLSRDTFFISAECGFLKELKSLPLKFSLTFW